MGSVSKKLKVILTDPKWHDLEYEENQLGDIAELERHNCKTEEELITNCIDADGLLVTYAPITAKVIKRLKKCKIISVFAIGLDMIDIKAATERGIPVTNVPNYCIEEVCDHTFALLLGAARKIQFYRDGIVKNGQWNYLTGKPINRLRGRTLGLLGFGKISRAVTIRAKAFGLDIIAFDPYISLEECEREGVALVKFDELLTKSDFISIHSPLTKETKGLINYKCFKLMKRSAIIVNASRGPIIVEKDLVKALDEQLIAGAALDVLEIEPPDRYNQLILRENVILTPHAGFYSEEAIRDLRLTAALQVRKVLMHQEPDYLVNPDVTKALSPPKKEKYLNRNGLKDRMQKKSESL